MPRFSLNSICHAFLALGILSTNSSILAGELFHNRTRAQPNVSPMDELEILDPRVDPEGKPRALILPGANGLQQVDIPPTIIVHRYYYTGDRDFQAPLLKGGPTTLAVNDPATGEQVYVDVLLPPGAPRIRYRRDRIVYEFRTQSVVVFFGHPGPLGMGRLAKPKVAITHHSAALQDAARHAEQHRNETGDWLTRTGIPKATTQVAQTGKQMVNTSADTIHTVGDRVSAPVLAVWKATPLSSLTTSKVKQPNFNEPGIR